MNKNKLKRILTFLLLIVLNASLSSGEAEVPMGTYLFSYEHNTGALAEDHYIVLSKRNGKIEGHYFGTSDDFDDAREGYLPGFYTAKMDQLKFVNNKFSFIVKPNQMYNKPITPHKKSSPNSVWDVVSGLDKQRTYYGEYSNGKLIIRSKDIDKRIFYKIK